MPANRFPRTARVRAKSDFDRIFKHGRRVALPVLALHWQATPAAPGEVVAAADAASADAAGGSVPGARLGLAVSRKVDPHAVGRNRIKRTLREAFRACRSELADGDYVVVARVGASRCTGDQLRAAFDNLLRRTGALPSTLPASNAVGTMPSPATAAPTSSAPAPPAGGA
jgi:ribonuclease P protein component